MAERRRDRWLSAATARSDCVNKYPGTRDAELGTDRTATKARSYNLRRPLREPRLAAGASEAADENHVGQRAADQSQDRERSQLPRRRTRRARERAAYDPRRSEVPRAHHSRSAVGRARPS